MAAEGERLTIELEAAAIIDHVADRMNADGWNGSRESLRLRRTVVRQFSRQFWFDVEGQAAPRAIVVKVCERRTPRRPRALHLPVAPPPDFDWSGRATSEYRALTAIERHFATVDDPRFGAVRTLGLIPELNAFITERFEATSLKATFRRASRLNPRRSPRELPTILSSAGAWLREYQRRPAPGGILRGTRDDFVAATAELCRTLIRATGEERFLISVRREMEAAADTVLPQALPTGAAHGDYGQANVLVTRDRRILVLDTLADWQVPLLEDLAYFLVGIDCSRIHVLTGGLAYPARTLETARRAFLDGYLAGGAEPAALAPYETLLVLDRWVAQLGKLDGGLVSRAKRRMVNDWFRGHTARTLGRLG